MDVRGETTAKLGLRGYGANILFERQSCAEALLFFATMFHPSSLAPVRSRSASSGSLCPCVENRRACLEPAIWTMRRLQASLLIGPLFRYFVNHLEAVSFCFSPGEELEGPERCSHHIIGFFASYLLCFFRTPMPS